MIRINFLLLVLLLMSASALAEDPWTLTTADFRSAPALLKSIDSEGITTTPIAGGPDTKTPYSLFLDIGRPLQSTLSPGAFVLHTLGGDLIGGEPVGIKGNDLIVKSPILDEIAIPLKQLAALTRPGGLAPENRQKEDVVTLSNGDTLRGIVADITNGKISVQTDSGTSTVPITAVSQINFAAAGSNVVSKGFRIRFDDGTSIVVAGIKVDGEKLELTLSTDIVRSVELSRVALIEQVNGPVSWLSSRPAVESVYIPFIGPARTDAARMNRNWTGHDLIRFGSKEFAHGIGVHSYSRLSWVLDGSYAAFRTCYAIDTKDPNPRADVTVRILLDGKVVYEQAHVRAGMMSPVIFEELGSAKKLTLEVDYGDNMDTQDRLNWIEPALLKIKPADTQPSGTNG